MKRFNPYEAAGIPFEAISPGVLAADTVFDRDLIHPDQRARQQAGRAAFESAQRWLAMREALDAAQPPAGARRQ